MNQNSATESQRLIQLFSKNPELILPMCKFYPWTEELLVHFADTHLLDWEYISTNEVMLWTDDIIARYSEKLDWWILSSNEKLPWTKALIEKYEEMGLGIFRCENTI